MFAAFTRHAGIFLIAGSLARSRLLAPLLSAGPVTGTDRLARLGSAGSCKVSGERDVGEEEKRFFFALRPSLGIYLTSRCILPILHFFFIFIFLVYFSTPPPNSPPTHPRETLSKLTPHPSCQAPGYHTASCFLHPPSSGVGAPAMPWLLPKWTNVRGATAAPEGKKKKEKKEKIFPTNFTPFSSLLPPFQRSPARPIKHHDAQLRHRSGSGARILQIRALRSCVANPLMPSNSDFWDRS